MECLADAEYIIIDKNQKITTFNELCGIYEENYQTWKQLPIGDPDREKLTLRNREILEIILNHNAGE